MYLVNVADQQLGATPWDIILSLQSIPFVIIFILIALVVYLIAHPEKAKEWGAIIATIRARWQPSKRRRAFSKNVDSAVTNAINKARKEFGSTFKKAFPHDLKIEWVTEPTDSLRTDKQAIIYVNDYTNQENTIVSVFHEYVVQSFAESAKAAMPESMSNGSNCLATKKLIYHTRPKIIDHFNRQFLPNQMFHNERYRITYDNLLSIDKRGLFLPVLINEMDKIVSHNRNDIGEETLTKSVDTFCNFILNIATRERGTNTPTLFHDDYFSVRIMLAVSDQAVKHNDITESLGTISSDVSRCVKTIYILGAGHKKDYARRIATEAYNEHIDYFDEPSKSEYKLGPNDDACCYELSANT